MLTGWVQALAVGRLQWMAVGEWVDDGLWGDRWFVGARCAVSRVDGLVLQTARVQAMEEVVFGWTPVEGACGLVFFLPGIAAHWRFVGRAPGRGTLNGGPRNGARCGFFDGCVCLLLRSQAARQRARSGGGRVYCAYCIPVAQMAYSWLWLLRVGRDLRAYMVEDCKGRGL